MGDLEAAKVTGEQVIEISGLIDELESCISAFYDLFDDKQSSPSLSQTEQLATLTLDKAQEVKLKLRLLGNINADEIRLGDPSQSIQAINAIKQKGDGCREKLGRMQASCKAALKTFA